MEDPNEIGGKTCHGSTLYVSDFFDGAHVVRGGRDGKLWVATFSDKIQANAFVSKFSHSASLIRGYRPTPVPSVSDIRHALDHLDGRPLPKGMKRKARKKKAGKTK